MPDAAHLIYAALAGIVQGITEWLPISSTAHLKLLRSLFGSGLVLTFGEGFFEMFEVVIQFGSVLAVIMLFFGRLCPFSGSKTRKERRETARLWSRILISSVPAGLAGVLINDSLDALDRRTPLVYFVIAGALFIYGAAFIIVERRNKNRTYRINSPEEIDVKTALGIGAFQTLALIPGTSRSGSTIMGASALGVSRKAAAEFSFFMAIPVMTAASGWKILRFLSEMHRGSALFGAEQIIILSVGTATSFFVSIAVVKFLIDFVRRHNFEAFGWYRIALSAVVVLYFTLK